MSSLADRLRGIITPNRADVVARAAPAVRATDGDLETLLDGKWYGHCFIVERTMPSTTKYGRATIGDLAERLSVSAHEAPLVCGSGSARPPFVFFDLETTGLSGGAGTQAFLIGCAWFEDDGALTTRQYLLARYSDERAMLAAVAEDFGRAGALVSFNGKSFDAPVLETRYLFHRLEWTVPQQPHIDVLHVAAYDAKSRIVEMPFVVPLATRREVVIQRDAGHSGISQEPIGEVASNEARTADDEVAPVVGHLVQTAKVFSPNLRETQ